jgi:Tol biopolymer transport system component
MIQYRKARGILSCPIEGGTPSILIDKNKHSGANWTPDGNWLFSDAQTHSPWTSLYFIRLADQMDLTINPPENVGGFLSWTGHGQKALFYRSSYNIIWGMRVASSSGGPSFEPVPNLPVFGARWNFDSKMIVVQGEDDNGDIAMRVVPLAGEESFLLDMDVSVDGKPFPYCSSPDGKKFLFKIVKDDKTDLYVVPISVTDARTTGPAIKLIEGWTCRGGWNVNLSWSPDGNKLALVHLGDIWISTLDGEKPVQITKTPEVENWPAWSPDGTMLSHKMHFESESNNEYRIIPSQGGTPIKIFKDCKNFRWAWLADSKSFAMVIDGIISINPIGDGESREILDLNSKNLDRASYLRCSPDGKYLAFVGRSKTEENQDTEVQLYRISIKDGKLSRLATDNTDDIDDIYGISWSPDGKWICYLYEKMGKVRPEGTMWEADLAEFLEKVPE